jgi:hypothetical protein
VPRGGARPGAGRPKGSKDRTNVAYAPGKSNAQKSNRVIKESMVQPPQIIDGVTGAVDPNPRAIPLSTLKHVRMELAWVYRAIDSGAMRPEDGTKRCYVLSKLGDVITVSSFEERLAQLEEQRAQFLRDRQKVLS